MLMKKSNHGHCIQNTYSKRIDLCLAALDLLSMNIARDLLTMIVALSWVTHAKETSTSPVSSKLPFSEPLASAASPIPIAYYTFTLICRYADIRLYA